MFPLRPIGTSFILRKCEQQTRIYDAVGKDLYLPDDEQFTRATVEAKGIAHSDAMQRLMDSIEVGTVVYFNMVRAVRIPGSQDLYLADLDSIACVQEAPLPQAVLSV